MKLALVGTSHKLAPVEVRERVALDGPAASALAHELGAEGFEAVCLSTCNRTELYVVAPEGDNAREAASGALVRLADGDLGPHLYRLTDEAAALHLFRVAAGLDSMVPGEGEILGQVRAAYEGGACGPVLDKLFRGALHAGRKARTETAIGESPASVSAAAGALAQQVFGELDGRRVLIVGAGEVGELAARNLVSRGAEIAFVANRTPDRATALAARLGSEPLALDRLGDALAGADVVVSSTGAPGFVITREQVEAGIGRRRGAPLFLIDLAVPRDVEPSVAGLEGCFVYDIDDLEAVVVESLAGRRREADRAETIVAAEAASFRDWLASLDLVPAITSLREHAEAIRTAELAKAEGRLGGLSESERRTVESRTSQIGNNLLHAPIVRAKESAAREGVGYADALRHLFGLDEDGRDAHPRRLSGQ